MQINRASHPVWTINKLKSQGFGRTLMHLLSVWCIKMEVPACISNPTILLSAPTVNTTFFWSIPATPITAEEWIDLCSTFDLHKFPSSTAFHSITAWSDPPVMKQLSSLGKKAMLLIMPFAWGFSSKKVTRALCWQMQLWTIVQKINIQPQRDHFFTE